MFKKRNSKILFFVFALLLVVVITMQISKNKKGERSFKKVLVEIDSAQVSKIKILTMYETKGSVELKNENSQWKVVDKNATYNADARQIAAMLSELVLMKPTRIAATNKEKWKEFELDDSTANHVQVYNKDGIVADFYVGKFTYKQKPSTSPYQQQPNWQISSFVRLAESPEVYAVEGFLRMIFNPDPNSYRDKAIISQTKDDWTKLVYKTPEYSYSLEKQGNNWLLGETVADSAKVANYFNRLNGLTGNNFVENNSFNLPAASSYSLRIEGNNIAEPIEIQVFPADSIMKNVITSSINKGSLFQDESEDLFNTLFPSKESFFAEENNIAQ